MFFYGIIEFVEAEQFHVFNIRVITAVKFNSFYCENLPYMAEAHCITKAI